MSWTGAVITVLMRRLGVDKVEIHDDELRAVEGETLTAKQETGGVWLSLRPEDAVPHPRKPSV